MKRRSFVQASLATLGAVAAAAVGAADYPEKEIVSRITNKVLTPAPYSEILARQAASR
jgi:hypothetical protein